MFDLFVQGGAAGMSLLTVELICLLLAAWKAPQWVKEIGLVALATGVFYQLLGLWQMCGVIVAADISGALIAGAFRVSLLSTMYGLIIYGLSLVIRIIQKPRA